MKTSHVKSALEEMDCRIVETGAGVEMPSSVPAQFKFNQPVGNNVDEFQSQLDKKGMFMFSPFVKEGQEKGAWFADVEVCTSDYKRLEINIIPTTIRIYPKDETPSLNELAQLTNAIEGAFDAELSHNPIDR